MTPSTLRSVERGHGVGMARSWIGRLTRICGQMVLAILLVNTSVPGWVLAEAPAAATDRPISIVALGDSLTSGFGVEIGAAFPVVLEKALKIAGHRVAIQNAGVAGDTTAGGLARLDWAVPDGTELVILELGANDMLGGLSPERARANLETIVLRLKGRGIEVMLAGMRASRNLGDDYANAFDRIFPDLATKYDLVLYPFYLAGVALDPKLNQPDGIHPTAAGVEEIVRRMVPTVEQALERVARQRRSAAAR